MSDTVTTVADSEIRTDRFSRLLLTVVDVLIGLLVFVLPFIMGGREAWGHWFLISVALLLGTAWALYATMQGRRYCVSWLEVFFLAGLAIAWFQVQPQSAETMAEFSAEYDRLLPTWSSTQDESETARWSTLSFTPTETQHAWWMLLAYAVILTVLFQRVRQPDDCHRLLTWVGCVGVSMTGFALLQWATSNDRFFWFYEHPYTDTTVHLKGAFTNRNHFAQFLSLSIGPLLWWLFRNLKRFLGHGPSARRSSGRAAGSVHSKSKKRPQSSPQKSQHGSQQGFVRALSIPILLLLCAVSVVIVAVLLSLSRGGMIAAGAVTLIASVGLWRGFRLGGAMAAVLLGGGVLLCALLAFSDQEQLQTKFDQLVSVDADQIDTGGNRRAIWAADARVIERFPLLGTGVGSHRDVYTLYMENYADFALSEMTHAESSFVHAALETGLVGAGCLVLALVFLVSRLVIGSLLTGSDGNRACAIAVAASAVGAILHAVVDFIWYVPAIVVLSLVLAVVGLKAVSRGFGTEHAARGIWFPRFGWAVVSGLCLVALVSVQPDLMSRIEGEQHWYAALRTKLDVPPDKADGFADLQAGDTINLDVKAPQPAAEAEADYLADEQARRQTAMLKYLSERIGHLDASVKCRPHQHRVQLALAEHLLKLFDLLQTGSDNPFPLNMLRDASINGGFASTTELRAWLKNTCGRRFELVTLADQFARESLSNCPVQGHAYLSLVETSFLHDLHGSRDKPLIDQAMLVRGYDPRVRFVAGREAIMNGDRDMAMQLWESVFHSNRHFRLNILYMAARQVPVEFFLQQFQPDVTELKDLLQVYQAIRRERDTTILLRALCAAIPRAAEDMEDEDERFAELMKAYGYARDLADLELAVRIARSTAEEFPLAFEPRYHLGMTLVELERPHEAIEHLQWCHEQDPGNIWIPRLIVRARRQMLQPPDESPPRLTQL